MCILIGKTLAVLRNCSLTHHSCLVKNAKITIFDKRVLSVVFMELKYRWLQTGLVDLENTKYLYFYQG